MVDFRVWWSASVVLSLGTGALAGIDCYVCDSTSQIGCAEFLSDTALLEPQSCANVYDAKYCVKMTQVFEEATISCYQCDGVLDAWCGEWFRPGSAHAVGLVARPCAHVHDAKYCVKTTGVFAGQLGTKRFCSSRDFGDYCEWVQRPGDDNTYQACVLTCSTDACNGSAGRCGAALLVAVATALGLARWARAVW